MMNMAGNLYPSLSTYNARCFFKIKIRMLYQKEIYKKHFHFVCRIRLYFNPFKKTVTFKTSKIKQKKSISFFQGANTS